MSVISINAKEKVTVNVSWARRVFTSGIFLRLVFPILLFGIWELATRLELMPTFVLPPLSDVAEDFGSLVASGELARHIGVSLGRAMMGFAIGSVLGILAGILMGWSKTVDKLLDFPVNFFRAIPKTALVPLFLVWFGLGEVPKILVILLGCFFRTVITTSEAAKNVDIQLIKSARSLGAKDWQILKEVVIPASIPGMFAGLRLAIVGSFIVLMMVEIVAGSSGIGYLLQNAREVLNMSTMFVALLIMGLIGYGLDQGLRYLEKKLVPWRVGKSVGV